MTQKGSRAKTQSVFARHAIPEHDPAFLDGWRWKFVITCEHGKRASCRFYEEGPCEQYAVMALLNPCRFVECLPYRKLQKSLSG